MATERYSNQVRYSDHRLWPEPKWAQRGCTPVTRGPPRDVSTEGITQQVSWPAGVAWRYGARTSPKEVPGSNHRTAALYLITLLQLSLNLSLPAKLHFNLGQSDNFWDNWDAEKLYPMILCHDKRQEIDSHALKVMDWESLYHHLRHQFQTCDDSASDVVTELSIEWQCRHTIVITFAWILMWGWWLTAVLLDQYHSRQITSAVKKWAVLSFKQTVVTRQTAQSCDFDCHVRSFDVSVILDFHVI